jgi:N6-L-threonylcarbamoyladenine synthase
MPFIQNLRFFILAIESSWPVVLPLPLFYKTDKEYYQMSFANQLIHNQYGGVVPELTSRVHQQNIVPVIDAAL